MDNSLFDREKQFHIPTYNRLPIEFVRGEDVFLWDSDGKRYVDFVAGLGVVNVGHSNKPVIDAFCAQARQLTHVSNLFYTKPQIDLAEKLTELSISGGKCFFGNSGAEANEGAIKLARRYGKSNFAPERIEIITALGSFHGRTMKALAATGQPEKQKPFEPLPGGFKHVPYNDIEAIKQAVNEKTVGIMLEVIQGEGGVYSGDKQYLRAVGEFCRKRRLLFMLDEVQTGMGRTGNMFAYQNLDLDPDIVTVAKGLANGFPIGALIAKDEIASSFAFGDHGSTFGGGPAVCAAALAVLGFIDENNLVARAASAGAYLIDRLEIAAKKSDNIKEVRGKGLMVGLELNRPAAKGIVKAMLEQGFVINNIGDRILRFLPPLTIREDQIDRMLGSLLPLINER